jgi:hypothetical protein
MNIQVSEAFNHKEFILNAFVFQIRINISTHVNINIGLLKAVLLTAWVIHICGQKFMGWLQMTM